MSNEIISAGARASKEILMKNQSAGTYKLLIQPHKYGGKGGLVIDESQAFSQLEFLWPGFSFSS